MQKIAMALLVGVFVELWTAPICAAMTTLQISARAISLEAGEMVVAIRVTNATETPFAGLTLNAPIPGGAVLQEILSSPLKSLVETSPGLVRWRLGEAPSRTILMFAYRAAFQAEGTAVRATVRWKSPVSGTAMAGAVIENATLLKTDATMSSFSLMDRAGTGFSFAQADGPIYFLPLGDPGLGSTGLMTPIPGMAARFFVPDGDRGMVSLTRLVGDPSQGTADNLHWLGVYRVTKEKAGSLILEVPLRHPAPPYSLVQVFVDEGIGFHEQSSLGTVTEDGLGAVFAVDGSSSYALGVHNDRLGLGAITLSRSLEKLWEGSDPTLGVAALFEETYSEILAVKDMIEGIRAALIGMTSAGGGGAPDADGDGLSDADEQRLHTDPHNPDTDNDNLRDGGEVSADTDPLDSDTDDDGIDDGDELVLGTDPTLGDTDHDGTSDSGENEDGTDPTDACSGGTTDDSDGDGATDACEQQEGTDPHDPNSKPDPFAPVPGCPGGVAACFSFADFPDLFYVTDIANFPATLGGFLQIPEASDVIELYPGAPVGGNPDGSSLRAIFGVAGNAIFTVIPAGQPVGVSLAPPLLKLTKLP